jgi:hypothetical protein
MHVEFAFIVNPLGIVMMMLAKFAEKIGKRENGPLIFKLI